MLRRSCPEWWKVLVSNAVNKRDYGRKEERKKGRKEERKKRRKKGRKKERKEERDSTLFANPNFSEVTK